MSAHTPTVISWSIPQSPVVGLAAHRWLELLQKPVEHWVPFVQGVVVSAMSAVQVLTLH